METNTADPGPAQHGVRFGLASHVFVRSTSEKSIAGAKKVDTHKTSMWQNVTVEHAPEINALMGSQAGFRRRAHTPTLHSDSAHAMVTLLASTMEKAHEPARMSPSV